MSGFHLAQVNIARMRFPLDSPEMAGFVTRLDEINALAERSPGFVWRFQTAEGNAVSMRAYEDERILFNLSVWESIDALKDYSYRTSHAELLRDRRQWFEEMEQPSLALWWIPAGHVPSVDEARQRLSHLQQHGPSPVAFTFRTLHAPDFAALPPDGPRPRAE